MDEARGTDVAATREDRDPSARARSLDATLDRGSEAIHAAATEAEVFEALCSVIVQHLNLPLVWVNLAEPGTHNIVVQAAAGEAAEGLESAGYRRDVSVPAGGIISQTLRTGRAHIGTDMAAAPNDSAGRARAVERGIRGSAAFPIRTGHTVVGSLLCTSHEPDYFDEAVAKQLGRLAAVASARLATLANEGHRREIERRLTDSEQRYRGLFDVAPVGIMVVGRGPLEVNRTLLEMFGYEDRAALEAAGAMSIIDPAHIAKLTEMITSLQPEDAAPHLLELVGRRSDGSAFPILVEGVQVDLDGRRSGLVFISDMSSLETAEAAAQRNKAQLSALIDRAPLAIMSLDLNGKVRSWNPAATHIFGWAEAEAIGQRAPIDMYADQTGRLGLSDLPQIRHNEVESRRRDGSAVELRVWSAPLAGGAGGQAGTMLIMDDVTSQNRLEAERARLAIAIDQASESIVITDPNALIVYVNPAFERLTGYTRSEVLGKNPRILQAGLHGREHYRDLWGTLGKSETWRGMFVNRRKDGTIFEEEASISPVFDPSGKLINYIAVKRDITRERELERERDRGEARYRQMFTEMLGGMAFHEIICDADGMPVDYRFLDVNPAFEALTGLRAEDIIGRTAREVLPGLEEEWIERYGRVAQTGVPDDFENFNADLGRYYQVRAYCPAPGQFAVLFHDVTEIRERTAFAESVLAGSGEGLIVFDRELRCVAWNAAMEERTGISEAKMIGRLPSDVLPANLAHDQEMHLRTVLDTGETRSVEAEFDILETGLRGWALSTYRPQRDHAGRIVGVVESVREFTQRKQAEDALRDHALYLQQLIDTMPMPVTTKRLDGVITSCNAAFAKKLDRAPSEIIGKTILDLGFPEFAEHAERDRAVLGDGTVQQYEIAVSFPGGEALEMITKAPMRGADGNIAGIVTTSMDITAHLRAEETLRRSEERFRAIFDHANDAIFIRDLDGRFLEANRTAGVRLGYSREELLTMSVADIDTPESAALVAERTAAIVSHGSAVFETTHRRRDGTTIPTEMSSTAIDFDGRPAILSIARDISERRGAEAENGDR